jgi:hypothetical protein
VPAGAVSAVGSDDTAAASRSGATESTVTVPLSLPPPLPPTTEPEGEALPSFEDPLLEQAADTAKEPATANAATTRERLDIGGDYRWPIWAVVAEVGDSSRTE